MPFERDLVHNRNTMTEPLLTIIVAAYNVEGYIEEALESLLSQPHIDQMKIIVVEDGSSDDTFAAAQAVADRDGGVHIEVVRQKNGGLSAARNAGLVKVRTPYVGFLDGDDIYLNGFTDAIFPALLQREWDMIEYNVKIIDDDGRELDDIDIVPQQASGGHPLTRDDLRQFAETFHTFVWARIYRTAFFDNLTFPQGRHYEDMAVLPSLYLRAESIYRIAEPLIGYRRRFGSITQKARLRDMDDLRNNGREALARCNGGELDAFWLTVFDKIFQRACHVCARVEYGAFKAASETLSAMFDDHRQTRQTLAARGQSEVMELKPFDLNVRTDRSIHMIKGLVKKVLRRSMDHQPRARRASAPV
jgi:glycosyltransferase involved in cell wall biosynthesis